MLTGGALQQLQHSLPHGVEINFMLPAAVGGGVFGIICRQQYGLPVIHGQLAPGGADIQTGNVHSGYPSMLSTS